MLSPDASDGKASLLRFSAISSLVHATCPNFLGNDVGFKLSFAFYASPLAQSCALRKLFFDRSDTKALQDRIQSSIFGGQP
jgi:hypothetical protein